MSMTLQIADFRLQIADCRLQSVLTSDQTAAFRGQKSPVAIGAI